MKVFIIIFTLGIFGCQSNTGDLLTENNNPSELENRSLDSSNIDEDEKRFRDSLYNRESENFISKLEEIPGRDSNAYKLTISSKKGNNSFFKVLNTRPMASLINECNDLYTVVGFSCGGPCTSKIFVFTDKERPIEQYSYAHVINEKPNIIIYTKEEEFQNLIIHNLNNGKEIMVHNRDIQWQTYGQMNKFNITNNKLEIEYTTVNETTRKKTIYLQKILN
jgi:hypothetical protein